jgi:integrase/recombinase XerD
VTREVLGDYRAHLYERQSRKRRISATTQSRYLSQLRLFFGYLVQHGFIAHDPSVDLQLPRASKPLPRVVLSELETAQVCDGAGGKDPIDIRNRAIVELLYCTGIRNSELRALTVDDLNLASAEIQIIRGKGGKSRTLPLGDDAKHWMAEYLAHSRPHLVKWAQQRILFLSLHGRPIGRACLGALVRAVAKKAGVDQVVTPHVLRRSCATHMLRRGAGLRQLQEFLGHETLQSLQHYTRLDTGDLRQVLVRCHPRETKS